MTDLGDSWKAHKAYVRHQKRKHETALEQDGYRMIERGIHDNDLQIQRLDDYKWRISDESGSWTDYWPTTGRIYGNGIDSYEREWIMVGKTIANLLKNN